MRSSPLVHLALFAAALLMPACGSTTDDAADAGQVENDAGADLAKDAGSDADAGTVLGDPIPRVAGGAIGDGVFILKVDNRRQYRFAGSRFATTGSSMQWVEGSWTFDTADGHCVFSYDSGVTLDDKYFLTTDGGSRLYIMVSRRIEGEPGSNSGKFEAVATMGTAGIDPITTTYITEVRPDGYWSHYVLEPDGDRDYLHSSDPNAAAKELFFIEYGGADYVAEVGSEYERQ